ncbi:MAG: hypothetical protein JKX76_02500 [Colwellia sp.]|nr:hypothetical protein [Colwellia sp.]
MPYSTQGKLQQHVVDNEMRSASDVNRVAQQGEQPSNVYVIESSEDFNKLLNNSSLIIVDNWQDACEPCDILAPMFSGLADDITDFCKNQIDDPTIKVPVVFASVNAMLRVIPVEGTPICMVFKRGDPTTLATYGGVEGFKKLQTDLPKFIRRHTNIT